MSYLVVVRQQPDLRLEGCEWSIMGVCPSDDVQRCSEKGGATTRRRTSGRRADMAPSGGAPDLSEITQWFADRGFGVEFAPDADEDDEPFFWADLTRLPSGRVVAPKYGRGVSDVAAALSAQERFEVEQ